MENNSKKILKIWLIAYAVLSLFNIIHRFAPNFLEPLMSIGTYTLMITSVILYVYVYNRGEKLVAKVGLIAVLVYFVLNVLENFDVFDYSFYRTVGFFSRLLSTIQYTANNITVVCDFLAIFSFVKSINPKIDKCKLVTICGLAVYTVFGFIVYLIPSLYESDFVANLRYTIQEIAYIAKNAAIILYLTDVNYKMLIPIDNNNSTQELLKGIIPNKAMPQANPMPNQYQQPMMNNQMPNQYQQPMMNNQMPNQQYMQNNNMNNNQF